MSAAYHPQALAESRSEHVQSILNLDDRAPWRAPELRTRRRARSVPRTDAALPPPSRGAELAREQQTRQEAQLLLKQTQDALAERASREAEATRRVQQAEKTLAAYKARSRELPRCPAPSHPGSPRDLPLVSPPCTARTTALASCAPPAPR